MMTATSLSPFSRLLHCIQILLSSSGSVDVRSDLVWPRVGSLSTCWHCADCTGVRCFLPVSTMQSPCCSARRCRCIFLETAGKYCVLSKAEYCSSICCLACILSWVSHSMCACVSLLMTLHNRRPGSHRPTLTATPVQLTCLYALYEDA